MPLLRILSPTHSQALTSSPQLYTRRCEWNLVPTRASVFVQWVAPLYSAISAHAPPWSFVYNGNHLLEILEVTWNSSYWVHLVISMGICWQNGRGIEQRELDPHLAPEVSLDLEWAATWSPLMLFESMKLQKMYLPDVGEGIKRAVLSLALLDIWSPWC